MNSRKVAGRGAVAVAACALLLCACGDVDNRPAASQPGDRIRVSVDDAAPVAAAPETATAPSTPPDATAATAASPDVETTWTASTVGPTHSEGGVAVLYRDGATVAVVAGARNGLEVWIDRGDGFTLSEVVDPVVGKITTVGAAAVVDAGFVVAIGDYETFQPTLWFSATGDRWERLDQIGIDGPADVISIIQTSEGVVVTGVRRVGERPSTGPFEAAVWTSTDLRTWTAAEVEAGRNDVMAAVVETPKGLLALGRSRQGPAVWHSDDATRWIRDRDSSLADQVGRGASIYAAVADGANIAAVGAGGNGDDESALLLVTSTDGGATWQEGVPAPDSLYEAASEITVAAGAFWVTTSDHSRWRAGPDLCYADLTACSSPSLPVLLRSSDGIGWSAVDISGIESGEYFQVGSVVERDDGFAVAGFDQNGLTLWDHPASMPALAGQEPAREPAAVLSIPLADPGTDLDIGVLYRYPLYVHCGMDFLGSFGGAFWYLGDGPAGGTEIGAGQIPRADWPVAGETIYGFVTRIDEATIEYSIGDGDVIAVYEPSEVEPPGCV